MLVGVNDGAGFLGAGLILVAHFVNSSFRTRFLGVGFLEGEGDDDPRKGEIGKKQIANILDVGAKNPRQCRRLLE